MTDLAEWLLAQYAADEQAAQAAAEVNPPPWVAEVWRDELTGLVVGGETDQNRHLDGGLWDNEGTGSLSMEPATAVHVARHDPAAVLADLAAKRRIVELHRTEEACSYHSRASEYSFGCRTCHFDPECGYVIALGWCDTVRLLVVALADREGYDESWKPA